MTGTKTTSRGMASVPRKSRRRYSTGRRASFELESEPSTVIWSWGSLTEAGRYLFIVLEFQRGNQAYVITAREMTDEEKKRFKAGR